MSVKFEATPIKCVYNSENFKVYGCEIDKEKYPNIKVNNYGNVTISGVCPELTLDMVYSIEGVEEQGKYGYGYKINYIKQNKPMSTDGLKEFLIGCGLSYDQTKEIVREYPNIIELVTNNKENEIDISKLHNIGEYRIGVIIRKIQENFLLADLVEQLGGYFDFNTIKKLYEKYHSSEEVVDAIKAKPYESLCQLSRIGFKTADTKLLVLEKKIKENLKQNKEVPFEFVGDLKTSKDRCLSALCWLLDENEVNGNTIMEIKTIGNELRKLTPECFNHFVDICKNANTDEALKEHIYVDLKNKWIANRKANHQEKVCAEIIAQAINNPVKWDIDICKYRSNGEIQLTDEQLHTLQMVCDNQISVLSGFGGSGKSASTLSLIQMLKDNKKDFLLLAPTGRASKVLSEYTHCKASTIHKLLFFIGDDVEQSNNKLTTDIIIVDEISMCDISLFYSLLNLIDFSKTKLLLVGDPAQLPSVSCGNVLYDIIHSEKIPVNSLTKIFRYGDNAILTVATDVRNSTSYFGKELGDTSYAFVETPQETMVNKVKALYKKLLDNGYNKEDVLILSAYNTGNYGTVIINNTLQSVANPNVNNEDKTFVLKNINETTKFCVDDMVIQTKNNYKAKVCDENYNLITDNGFNVKQVFVPNGEIGVVKHINKNFVFIQFDNNLVVYDRSDMCNVKLGYAISIHKSQGGSAKAVIVLTPKAHTFFLNSNLLYVAVTRAKERVFHFGTKQTINAGIKKKAELKRNTWLMNYIIDCFNDMTNKQNNITDNKED